MDHDNSDHEGSIDLSTRSRYLVRDKRNLNFLASGSLGLHPELGHETLELAIFTRSRDGDRSAALRGKEQFSNIVAYFRGQFESIRAYWISEDNLATFNRETIGVDPRDVAALKAAALKTWTGVQAAAAGYSQVEVGPLEGEPGRYTSVEVTFIIAEEIRQQGITGEAPVSAHVSAASMSRILGDLEQQLLRECFEISEGLAAIQRDLISGPGSVTSRQRPLPRISQETIAPLRMEIDELRGNLAVAVDECRRNGNELSSHTQKAVDDLTRIIERTEESLFRASKISGKKRNGPHRNRP
jgi:hypothetical protein